MRKPSIGRRVLFGLAVLCLVTGVAAAQQTTVEVRNGTVLAVNGNLLTVRGPEGVKQFYVSDDFRFDLDGRKLSVHELKPGMPLTAVVTTTGTPVQMTTTEYREAEVVHVATGAVVIRNQAGELKQYTAKDVAAADLLIFRGDQPVTIYDLRKGDKISATIVSKQPPVTITASELEVFAQNAPSPPRPAAAPPKPAPAPAPATTTVAATMPKTGSVLPRVGIVGLVLLGLGVVLTGLRRSV